MDWTPVVGRPSEPLVPALGRRNHSYGCRGRWRRTFLSVSGPGGGVGVRVPVL